MNRPRFFCHSHFHEIAYFYFECKIYDTLGIIQVSTAAHNGLHDITRQVEDLVVEGGIEAGMLNVYAQGATSTIMKLAGRKP